METAQYRSMLDETYENGDAVSPGRDAFVYDDDLSWDQPLETAAVKRPEPRPARPAPGPSQSAKRAHGRAGGDRPPRRPTGGGGSEKPDHPGWRAYVCVAVITLSFLCMLVLAVVMMTQMACYFWKDFCN